ncbi:MAG: type IV toxin-antitoxin system AbiEi family antitoxin domain-containing protein [Solirubrobacterales bacterium]
MPDVGRKASLSATECVQRHLDRAIQLLAGRQHGVISLAQLVGLGLTPSGVRDRVARGALVRIHQGVYAVGHTALKREGHWSAAVLACGDGALLSHRTAAAQLSLRPTARSRIDVTVRRRGGRRSRKGLDIHRSSTLAPQDITLVDNIPTTSVARTLLDLAATLHRGALAQAFDRAEILRIFDMRVLEDVIHRNPGHHGLRPLRALLSSLDPKSKHTRKELERRLLALCREAGLPAPDVNEALILEGRTVHPDFLWRAQRFVVETDGWESHGTRLAFERDRAKDALLLRAGYRTVRFTWRQLLDDPAEVLATIQAGIALAA